MNDFNYTLVMLNIGIGLFNVFLLYHQTFGQKSKLKIRMYKDSSKNYFRDYKEGILIQMQLISYNAGKLPQPILEYKLQVYNNNNWIPDNPLTRTLGSALDVKKVPYHPHIGSKIENNKLEITKDPIEPYRYDFGLINFYLEEKITTDKLKVKLLAVLPYINKPLKFRFEIYRKKNES